MNLTAKSNWKRIRLGEVAHVISGFAFKSESFGSAGVPVLKISNIRLGTVDLDDIARVSETYLALPEKFHVKSDDILVSLTGSHMTQPNSVVGRVALYPKTSAKALLNQRAGKVIVDTALCDPRFLFYALLTDKNRQSIAAMAHGAASQANVSPSQIESLIIDLPPIEQQQAIAATLSAYDDLIENNTRRIQILEEMARALYREWFVEFRFPGYASARMVNTALGPTPENWKVISVTQAVEINPTTKVTKDGSKPFVPMGCLSNTLMLISEVEAREGNSGSKFKNGDTLFARITPCLENGKTGFVQFLPSKDAVAFGSTEFIVMRSRTVSPEYVYLLARSNEFRDNAIQSMSGATGRQRVQEACFDKFMIAQPASAVLTRFSEVVGPIFQMIHATATKNSNLRHTRDLLLPKLISGNAPV